MFLNDFCISTSFRVASAVTFDGQTYDLCDGAATVTWNGYHNIQEVTAEGYAGYTTSAHIGTEIHPFENSGTVLNVTGLAAATDRPGTLCAPPTQL